MAAAVPWPPTNPAAKRVPNPGCSSGQIKSNTAKAKNIPSPHCHRIKILEYIPISPTLRPLVLKIKSFEEKGSEAKINVIKTPG